MKVKIAVEEVMGRKTKVIQNCPLEHLQEAKKKSEEISVDLEEFEPGETVTTITVGESQ